MEGHREKKNEEASMTCTQCGQHITPEIGCVCIGDKDDQGDMFGDE